MIDGLEKILTTEHRLLFFHLGAYFHTKANPLKSQGKARVVASQWV